MAYGDVYASQGNIYEEWLKQMQVQQETANPFSAGNNTFSAQQDPAQDQVNAVGGEPEAVEPVQPQAQQKPAGGGIISTIGGVVGGIYGGPAGSAAGSAVGKMVEGGQQGKDSTTTGQDAIKSGVMSYLGGQAVGATGGESVFGATTTDASAAGNTQLDNALGSTTEASGSDTLANLYRGGDTMAGVSTQAQPALLERGWDAAKNYTKNATHGLIGGNFDAREGTGAFMNDFINGLENGGGIDTGVGAIKGGAYGEALGSGTKFVLNNYRPPQPAPAPRFTQDEYRKRNRYA